MPTTIKGIYHNGIIKPLVIPPQIKKAEVIITFVNFKKNNKPEGNARRVLNILENYRGILAKNFIDKSSVDYVNDIREKTNREWEQRLKRLGIK